eukprot:m.224015 g.224015  ORF g.224015 m.224015 type:complete len:92 (+) comp15640_c0_seq15:97-372(+)
MAAVEEDEEPAGLARLVTFTFTITKNETALGMKAEDAGNTDGYITVTQIIPGGLCSERHCPQRRSTSRGQYSGFDLATEAAVGCSVCFGWG